MNMKNEIFSLNSILSSVVLLEGRKEDVMTKYPDVPKEVVENLSQKDPSGNNKYLEWMVAQYKNINGGADRIIELVKNYHDKLGMIGNKENIEKFSNQHSGDVDDIEKISKNPKDINSFRDFQNLSLFIGFMNTLVTKKQELEEIKKGTDRVYEDTELLVVSPKTHKASCHYGKHSGWCVSTSSTGHFSNYTKNGTLYFFISKVDKPYNEYWSDATSKQSANEPPYKTALLLGDNGDISWWSKGDRNYSSGWVGDPKLPMLTQGIADKILRHNEILIRDRKQREIEVTLITTGFYKKSGGDSGMKNNLTSFVRLGVFNAENLISIIRNDNWLALYENSETGDNIRKILGQKLVLQLVKELLITSSNITSILKDMSTQDFFTNNAKSMGDDGNKEITSIIIEKLGQKPTASAFGPDIKMYVDRWTMSEKETENYEKTSSYFFIGESEIVETGVDENGEPKYKRVLNIENLSKIDRFSPKDNHTLRMMMLDVKYRNTYDVYGVSTPKDSLDKYLDETIPESVVKMITDKAYKLPKRN